MSYYPGKYSHKNARCCNVVQFLVAENWWKSVMYFHSGVDLCYEIGDEELISVLHNGQLNIVYMTQVILFLGKLEELREKNIYHLYKMQ